MRRDLRTHKRRAGIQTYARATRGAVHIDATRVRLEVGLGVLGGDAALDGGAARHNRVLRQTEVLQRAPSRNQDLRRDNVHARDLLGDGVLHLQTGVDLNEVVAVLLVHQELGSTSVAIVGRLGEAHRIGQNGLPHVVGKVARRRNLHHFLVAALDRAVTLEQIDAVVVSVRKELHLNVTGVVQEPLDKHGRVAKRRTRLGHGTLERLAEVLHATHNTHAATTTAHGGFDDHGKAHFLDEWLSGIVARNRAGRARHNGNLRITRQVARLGLVAQRVNRLGTRAHKRNAGLFDLARKLGVLREEPVAGMNHIHLVFLRNTHDVIHGQIRSHWRHTLADLERVVGLVPVCRHAVLMAVDCDRLQAQFVCRTEDTNGNFLGVSMHCNARTYTTVGDHQAAQRHAGPTAETIPHGLQSTEVKVGGRRTFTQTLFRLTVCHLRGRETYTDQTIKVLVSLAKGAEDKLSDLSR